jgi:hypothetical protein
MTRPVSGAGIVGRRSIDKEQRMGRRVSRTISISDRQRAFAC